MQNMDFWFFWNIFRKRWNIILFAACTAAILSGVYSNLFIEPVYDSSVSLYLGRVTENPSMEKMLSEGGGLGTAAELNLGSQLSGDYQQLIKFDIITEGVLDELAKSGKWQKMRFRSSAELIKNSRIMKIRIESSDPIYSQETANIYAKEFIRKAPSVVGVQNAQVIEEAALNWNAVSPDVPKNIFCGFIGGFVLAFLFCAACRSLDKTLRTSAEVEQALHIPVVGMIHQNMDFAFEQKKLFLFGEETGTDPRTLTAEDFRVFRVNLINRKKEEGFVIAITGTRSGDGKTFCTANLSASLAEAGYKVLLIDCDTGKNGLQSYTGLSGEKGLMDILQKEADFEHTVKRNLNGMNLDVLFCGNKKVNSANLMISSGFKDLMNQVKKEYDFTLLDVSCQFGTADIVSAGSSADTILLLVCAGKTDRETAKQTVETLTRANLDISGVILNGTEGM